jgi:hypothetical protein
MICGQNINIVKSVSWTRSTPIANPHEAGKVTTLRDCLEFAGAFNLLHSTEPFRKFKESNE